MYLNSEELRVNLRVQTFEVCVWWYHSFLENQDRFNYACNTTRTFQMSNVACDSTTIRTLVTIVKLGLETPGTLDGIVECHEKFTYTYNGSSGLRTILKADPSAPISRGSPTGVPVPWASKNLVLFMLSPAFK